MTWNDFGESSYVGPIKGSQPNSQAWTDSMDHTGKKIVNYHFLGGWLGNLAWLSLTKYYATAFKTGQYPTIEKDQIVMWSRPHSTSASAPDPVPQPSNFQLVCHSLRFLMCLLMSYYFSLKIVFGSSYWPPPLLTWSWQLRRQRHSMFLLVSPNFLCLFSLETLWKRLLNVMGKLSLNYFHRTLRSKLILHLITLMLLSQVQLRIESVYPMVFWIGSAFIVQLYIFFIYF